ncbi:6-phospho-beta-glucosidase [Dactylosporangium roseum]|uniref:6-phospho-beta-glucosidase n=1 Tax=Dactylosporangium roseum TaxID=47989 RepID=A0ABY5ZB31_9ACTN|nr:6-phospho-beta-glucosidase [Dactylosporangium roseum]UWZ39306.1 6-phospho-beta-glucosidase [Dactylosporangium roseum]
MKLAVVGGGSTYTPELIDGIDELDVTEVTLIDPDPDRRRIVGGFAQRLTTAHVVTTDDLAAGVEDADMVVVQLRVGGWRARHDDETFPLECGCVGQETTGAGGLAKALRTVPVVLNIARVVRERAPRAWIVNFTNPVGIVTRALLDEGHRAVGLCNVAISKIRWFAEELDVDPDRLRLDYVGLNHLSWVRQVFLDGEDVLPDVLARHSRTLADDMGIPEWVLRDLGSVPSSYLKYFYSHDAEVAAQRGDTETRAQIVARTEAKLLDLYADPALTSKPALLSERGGAYYSHAAVDVMAGLLGRSTKEQVVDVRNDGLFPFLPPESIIEVPVTVSPDGAVACPLPRPVEPVYAGLIAHMAAYEELAVRAAMLGGVERVRTAMLAHPTIGQAEAAHRLADLLVSRNRDRLDWL